MKFSRRRSESIKRPWPAPPARWYDLTLNWIRSWPHLLLRWNERTQSWQSASTPSAMIACEPDMRLGGKSKNKRKLLKVTNLFPEIEDNKIAGSGNVPSVMQHLVLQTITGAIINILHFLSLHWRLFNLRLQIFVSALFTNTIFLFCLSIIDWISFLLRLYLSWVTSTTQEPVLKNFSLAVWQLWMFKGNPKTRSLLTTLSRLW